MVKEQREYIMARNAYNAAYAQALPEINRVFDAICANDEPTDEQIEAMVCEEVSIRESYSLPILETELRRAETGLLVYGLSWAQRNDKAGQFRAISQTISRALHIVHMRAKIIEICLRIR